MDVNEFREKGHQLYGWGWQTRLAELLGVAGQSVRRWASGSTPVPQYVAVVVEQAIEIRALREKLEGLEDDTRL